MFNQKSFVTEILNHGIEGYTKKNTGCVECLTAIITVNNGKTYLSKEVTYTIMKSLMKPLKAANSIKEFIPKISCREKEVFKLIVEEFTTQEIAKELFISLKTV